MFCSERICKRWRSLRCLLPDPFPDLQWSPAPPGRQDLETHKTQTFIGVMCKIYTLHNISEKANKFVEVYKPTKAGWGTNC